MTTYEGLLSLWARIRELEVENKALKHQIWWLNEGWDPGQ